LFLEHGLSPEPSIQRWQRRLNWLQRRVGDNCHLDRDMEAIVRRQPFTAFEIGRFDMEDNHRTYGHTYEGVATK
jgi:hypothetical protein